MARIWRLSFRSTWGTLEVVNTVHYRTAVDPDAEITSSEPAPQAVLDELQSHLQTPYRAMLDSNYTLASLTVVSEEDPTNPAAVPDGASEAVGLAGTRVNSAWDLPAPMCAVMKFTTDHVGRSFRGRMFLPPAESNAQLVGNVWTTAGTYLTNARAFGDALVQGMGGGSTWGTLWTDTWHARQVVYSKTRRARGLSPWWSYVNAYAVPTEVHWLRSRRK